MASSRPSIESVEIPSEVPPQDTFTVPVTVRQNKGPDPFLSSGACPAKGLDPTGWVTPVTLWVDGQRRDTQTLCLANDTSRETKLTLSLPPGEHRVEVRVHQVGDAVPLGQTWKQNLQSTTFDDYSRTVSTARDAEDPTKASAGESILNYARQLADTLGTSTTMIAVGAIGAVLLLGVL